MEKDIKRLVLAVAVGSFAMMTGCGQSNNGMMKNRSGETEQKMGEMNNSRNMDEDQRRNDDSTKEESGDNHYYRSECN